LKIDKTPLVSCGWPDFDAVWQADAAQHADYGDMVDIDKSQPRAEI